MFFVKLTRKASGKPVYINPFNVQSFSEFDTGTALEIGESIIAVSEDVDAVRNAVYNTLYYAVDSVVGSALSRAGR